MPTPPEDTTTTEETKPAETVEGQEPVKTTTEQGNEPDEQATSEEETGEKLSHDDALAALTKTRTEAASWRTKFRDLEKTLAEAKTPEQVEEIVTGMKAERETSERALLVENVALKFSLPDELAELLQGADRAALEAHAKKLQKFAPAEEKDPNDLDGGLDPSDKSGEFDAVALSRKARQRRY